MGCCKNKCNNKLCNYCERTSTIWLYIINFIVGVLGVFILISAIVLSVQSGDLIAGLGSLGIVGPSISGALIFLVSLLGCAGVYFKKKCLLVTYFIIMFVLAVTAISVGAVLTFYVDDVNNIDGEDAEDFIGTIEGQINDYIIAIFNECCASQQIGVELLGNCEDAEEGEACFTFIETYQDALERVQNTGVCEILENTEIDLDGNEVPVVGDVADGGCGGGDGQLFVDTMSQIFQDLLQPIGGSVLGVGVVLLLAAISSCCLVCADKDIELNYDVASWDLRGKKGNDLAYGEQQKRRRRDDDSDFDY